MSVRVMEIAEREPCVVCGERLCFERGYGPEFGLCSTCAGDIAELYQVTHGGEPSAPRVPKRPMVSPQVRWKVFREAGFTCANCGCTDRALHLDHIIPLARGGENNASNFQCLCDKCNMSKGAK